LSYRGTRRQKLTLVYFTAICVSVKGLSVDLGVASLAGREPVLAASYHVAGASSYASELVPGCLVGVVIDMIEAAML
jgi:hypothetical protein